METRRTIEQLIMGQTPDGVKQLVYFKECEQKVYGFESDKQGNYILTRNPEDPNASRDYETAIRSHKDLTIDKSDLANSLPETEEDKVYNPDVFKDVEQRIKDPNFVMHPRLSVQAIPRLVTMAASDATSGFFDMFKPDVFWKNTGTGLKLWILFASIQVAGILFHQIFYVEHALGGKIIPIMMDKAITVFCNLIRTALY